MKDDAFRFLSLLAKTPARFDIEQVAWLLNCQPHDIPALVRARLLKPLGNPPPNARKLFAADEIIELSRDKAWLNKASNAIHESWRKKNRARKETTAEIVEQPLAA